MASAVSGLDLGAEICEALGIPPDNVTGITIRANVRDLALVTVDMYLFEDNVPGLKAVMERYQLVKNEDTEPDSESDVEGDG